MELLPRGLIAGAIVQAGLTETTTGTGRSMTVPSVPVAVPSTRGTLVRLQCRLQIMVTLEAADL
ncbi:MAG: hypothetical protein KIT35_20570 [Piscinibacter sp.]|uniref:hypothetical protein n=1 Tax=Piscinibacter sp. TaxID=1903157 RepID=UPI002587919D|nr:hypothetical protein [Piscinibacter sp.]MCW5666232.1 hypothetical protein [Piscinibacter sp.]